MKRWIKKHKILFYTIISLLIIAIAAIAFLFFTQKGQNILGTAPKMKEVIKKKTSPEINVVKVQSKNRPYAVMINNLNEARVVQSGLSSAYIVYEIVAEAGITRYLALFKDYVPSKIGSVRSARHYYLDYVLENDAIYVHWGWSPQAQSDISSLGINNINGLTYEGVYFYRDNPFGISSEHTGFTDANRLSKAMDKLGYRKQTDKGMLLDYSGSSIDLSKHGETEDAKNVVITYSDYVTNKYTYNEKEKVYYRFVNGKEQNDYGTGKQLKVKNIIVYSIRNYAVAGDIKGRQNLDNLGSGEGYFITEGKAIKIKWSKKDRASKTVYTYMDGTEIKVNDGNTFIQIVPTTGNTVIG